MIFLYRELLSIFICSFLSDLSEARRLVLANVVVNGGPTQTGNLPRRLRPVRST